MKKNYGYIKPKIKNYHRHFHKLGDVVPDINPSGDWTNYLPVFQLQAHSWGDDMSCWAYAILQTIDTVIKFSFNEDSEGSVRYESVVGSGTPNGGDVGNGLDAVKINGIIQDSVLPATDPSITNWYKFHSPDPMTAALLAQGKRWLYAKYKPDWYWVFTSGSMGNKIKAKFGVDIFANLPNIMMAALRKSPLISVVDAWQFDANGYAYKTPFAPDNHVVEVYSYVQNQYWLAYDHYNQCHVKIEWAYPFDYLAGVEINKSTQPQTDAQYIIDNYYAKNVKGDSNPAIYFIYNNTKCPYPTEDDYNQICDEYMNGNRSFITVAQDALDLIPEGNPMLFTNIKNTPPFDTPANP